MKLDVKKVVATYGDEINLRNFEDVEIEKVISEICGVLGSHHCSLSVTKHVCQAIALEADHTAFTIAYQMNLG